LTRAPQTVVMLARQTGLSESSIRTVLYEKTLSSHVERHQRRGGVAFCVPAIRDQTTEKTVPGAVNTDLPTANGDGVPEGREKTDPAERHTQMRDTQNNPAANEPN